MGLIDVMKLAHAALFNKHAVVWRYVWPFFHGFCVILVGRCWFLKQNWLFCFRKLCLPMANAVRLLEVIGVSCWTWNSFAGLCFIFTSNRQSLSVRFRKLGTSPQIFW